MIETVQFKGRIESWKITMYWFNKKTSMESAFKESKEKIWLTSQNNCFYSMLAAGIQALTMMWSGTMVCTPRIATIQANHHLEIAL